MDLHTHQALLDMVFLSPDVISAVFSQRVLGIRYSQMQKVCKTWRYIVKKYAPITLEFSLHRYASFPGSELDNRLNILLSWCAASEITIVDVDKDVKGAPRYNPLICTNRILPHLTQMRSLESVAGVNACTEEDWHTLSMLPLLCSLRLQGASKLDGLALLSHLQNLRALDLLDIEVQSIASSEQLLQIATLTNLRVLLLGAHHHCPGEPLTALRQLEVLDFSSSRLSDLADVVHPQAPLRKLIITEPGIFSGKGIELFAATLQKLKLAYRAEHIRLDYLTCLTNLRSLHLGRMSRNFGGDIRLFNCPELKTLHCQEGLSDTTLKHLLHYSPKLRKLWMQLPSYYLNDGDLPLLAGLSQLRSLWLGPTPHLTTNAVSCFAQLRQLQYLRVDGNIASREQLLEGLPHVPVIITCLTTPGRYFWTVKCIRPADCVSVPEKIMPR
jgi:hypothetical protein